jgi:hypothetical protein
MHRLAIVHSALLVLSVSDRGEHRLVGIVISPDVLVEGGGFRMVPSCDGGEGHSDSRWGEEAVLRVGPKEAVQTGMEKAGRLRRLPSRGEIVFEVGGTEGRGGEGFESNR